MNTHPKHRTCDVCGAALAAGTKGQLCRSCWQLSQQPAKEPNPSGMCMCGCGLPAPIAEQTDRAAGLIRGKPKKFIRGHYQQRTQTEYRSEDRGYPGGPCWIWQRYINDQGYGVIRGNRGPSRAHRMMYERLVGPIPEGLELDHLCRVRSCVNPDHLEPVTPAENIRRNNSPASLTVREQRCQRGHDLSQPGAVYVAQKTGKRRCRQCQRERQTKYRKRGVMTIDVKEGK